MFSDECSHPPVIILLDGKAKIENGPIKNWLRQSRFTTCEAADLLCLMEEISDYTLSERPDVFVLEADSIDDDLDLIQQFIRTSGTEDSELPVLALSPDGKYPEHDCFTGSLQQVKQKLNSFIPKHLESKAAVL